MKAFNLAVAFILCSTLPFAACSFSRAIQSERSDLFSAVSGPLHACSANPRYFCDQRERAIYLTGSHTWPNLIDRGPTDPPPTFDFDLYLDLLRSSNHNFIRLWSRHVTRYQHYGLDILYGTPLPWPRTGPGTALDGQARFDLSQFDQQYFKRLRERVSKALERGMYVSIMLFGGHSAILEWPGNPFNVQNNVNGIDGDPDGNDKGDIQTLPLPGGVDAIQKAYVRKVIDAVGDFDNVLFEISNESESNSIAWQSRLVTFIKDYEAGRIDGITRKQHPVGVTGFWDTDNAALLQSPADWISPGAVFADSSADPYIEDPPPADGCKVSILDSDHLFFQSIIGNPAAARNWVWKSFLRGHNPILMENLFFDSTGRAVPVTTDDSGFVAARDALGQTRRYAARINLLAMVPRGDLSSTGYALADPGSEYLVYQPASGSFTVKLFAARYSYEWFNASSGSVVDTGTFTAGPQSDRTFAPPFDGDAVLYLKRLN